MSPIYDDREDDVALHTRRSPEGESSRRAPELDRAAPDREVTLSTGVVLGLFFALALLCAVFFGFGYSMGHKSAAAPVAVDTEPAPADASAATAAKPSASAPAATPVPGYVPSGGASISSEKLAPRPAKPVETATAASPASTPVNSTAAVPSSLPSAEKVPTQRPAAVVRTTPSASAPEAASAGVPPGSTATYVQVAAVSHQEDADVLSSALRRRGYAVLSRTDAADHLIHVQIGPFSNRKEAEATRLRLQGDGYNAFLK